MLALPCSSNLFRPLLFTAQRSDAFTKEVNRLWAMVAPRDLLSKSAYTKLITKCSRLIVPPPLDNETILQTAMGDWDRDLEWAREHGMVSESGNELGYKAFRKSIFELVDHWVSCID